MNKEIFQQNLNKQVKLICQDGYIYHCEIIKILDSSFQIKDRFGSLIWISYENVERLDTQEKVTS